MANYDSAELLIRAGFSLNKAFDWFAATCLTEKERSDQDDMEYRRNSFRQAMRRRGLSV